VETDCGSGCRRFESDHSPQKICAAISFLMLDEPENLVLRALREIREQNDTILRKLDEVVVRLSAVERDLTAMKVDYAVT